LSAHGSVSAQIGTPWETTFPLSTRPLLQVRGLSKHHRSLSEVKLEATLSVQILLDVSVTFAMSLCIGAVCGGAQVVGAWQAAKGIDLALTTSSEWKLTSELTSYAEYPEFDSTSPARR